MKRKLIHGCGPCGCAHCARQADCPNEDFACAECTPDNPAWNCSHYQAVERGGRGR